MTDLTAMNLFLYLTVGAALGVVYFAALYLSVSLYAARSGAVRALLLLLFRLAIAGGAFWLVAQQGAVPLLLALGGFLLARTVAQRRIAAR